MSDTNGTTALVEAGAVEQQLAEIEQQYGNTFELLQERIAELELALEDVGWARLGGELGNEFNRESLRKIARLARLFYLANPLINRAVSLQAFYVFGQGVTISARHPDVNDVVQAFLDDEKNRAELTSHQARVMKEVELQVEGNLFFALFTTAATGRVVVRTIPAGEISDIICNPEDAKDPWFYKRTWTQRTLDQATGALQPRTMTGYYPDWRHQPLTKRQTFGTDPVYWDTPVYHVRVGGLSDMRFGVPETYAAHDWARAYKSFLEDVATLMKTYARFAARMTTKGGKTGVAAAKAKLGTTLGQGGTAVESNPPPVAGGVLVTAEGVNYQPFNLRGASVNPEDGRRFLLMVAAATGFPESFFGDVSVGTLATAKSLDRPTELKFRDRQSLWTDIFGHLVGFAIDQAALAPKGALRGTRVTTDDGDRRVELATDPETGEPLDRHVDVTFPPILEHDVAATVTSIVKAATLDGKPLGGTFDAKLTTRMLLAALGEDDIDELIDQLFPEDQADAAGDPAAGDSAPAAEAKRPRRSRSAKVKPRGAPLKDVPDVVVISEQDLDAASAEWDRTMPKKFGGLLDAEAAES